jgi:hypothetical protein
VSLGGVTWWCHLVVSLGGVTWWCHLVVSLGGVVSLYFCDRFWFNTNASFFFQW